MLLTEFAKAFLYINRHLLYTENEEGSIEEPYGITKKELKKSLKGTVRHNHLSESHRDETRELLIAEPKLGESRENSMIRSVGQSGRDLAVKKNNSMIDETRQHEVSILSYDEA